MLKLLVALLATLALPTAVSAGFNSQWEARRACENWKQKGGTYKLYFPSHGKYFERNIRFCFEEVSTRQFIGFVYGKFKRNKKYYRGEQYENLSDKPRLHSYSSRFKW